MIYNVYQGKRGKTTLIGIANEKCIEDAAVAAEEHFRAVLDEDGKKPYEYCRFTLSPEKFKSDHTGLIVRDFPGNEFDAMTTDDRMLVVEPPKKSVTVVV